MQDTKYVRYGFTGKNGDRYHWFNDGTFECYSGLGDSMTIHAERVEPQTAEFVNEVVSKYIKLEDEFNDFIESVVEHMDNLSDYQRNKILAVAEEKGYDWSFLDYE